MRFEWDEAKATKNLAKHGVSFEEGAEVFYDPVSVSKHDARHSQDEDRYGRIGITSRGILAVVYTERIGDVIRIISARKASRRERRHYYDQERKN